MKVLKFGGSSVGSIDGILNLKRIVESQKDDVIVVVSALGGVTDRLIATAKSAASGSAEYAEQLAGICARHRAMIDDVVPDCSRETTTDNVEELLKELTDILDGITSVKCLTDGTMDAVVSYGERLSSQIVAGLLDNAELLDSCDFIKTEHGRHTIDRELTERLVRSAFSVPRHRTIVPGFIASDAGTGMVTNLGRGGSDYSASLIAAAIDASCLEIWTDVDGFMTADPRVISSAYTIGELSYVEAMELCNFGAKVVYPPTIYPVCIKDIPIYIRNTFNPDAAGTVILKELPASSKPIKGISSISNTALVTIRGLGMVGVIGVNLRIFGALAREGISVFMVCQASSENSTSIGVRNEDTENAINALNAEFATEIANGQLFPLEIKSNLATVAIVGENLRSNPCVAGKLFSVVGRNGINAIACSQSASQTSISFVVEAAYLRKTLNVIHDSFFLSEYHVLNLFIFGTGTVGNSLINQIRMQREKLMEKRGLKLNVVGIADDSRAVFSREGLELKDYRNTLMQGRICSLAEIGDSVTGMNIFNSVFVDCSDNRAMVGLYREFLDGNISVVSANSEAVASDFAQYDLLKHTARERGVKFLFGTNVGAGLPIISTINDLTDSGDRILKIEALLGGAVNFILDMASPECRFSDLVRLAVEKGFCEPDPRNSLCGRGEAAKLVVMARESGYDVEQEDVSVMQLIPQNLLEVPLEEFWNTLPSLDDNFEKFILSRNIVNGRLRYVAKMEYGKCSVSFETVDGYHPFYHQQINGNTVLITSERYKEYPLRIQGYGGGAAVTAAGVFAEIMSISNV